MKRTLLPLDITTVMIRMKHNEPLEDLEEDLVEVCKYVTGLDEKLRKKDFAKTKKVLYMDTYEYDGSKGTLYIKFSSARYAKSRNVINTQTLKPRGYLKRAVDGDEEKTHIVIKFDGNDRAVCIYEKNMDGAGAGQLFEYLNDFIIRYHNTSGDSVYYALVHSNIVSKEFLEALEKVRRIKAVTLTVDQEDLSVSETKAFAGRDDLSNEVDIYLRPSAKGRSITGDTVKDFYKMYNDSHKKVKRITVNADNEIEGPIVFNTDKIKAKAVVDVAEKLNGEVKEESIKKKLFDVIKEY